MSTFILVRRSKEEGLVTLEPKEKFDLTGYTCIGATPTEFSVEVWVPDTEVEFYREFYENEIV